MAAAQVLGAEWVAAYGHQGRLRGDQREELRTALLRDIEARGGARVTDVQGEVERFLQNGRVSDTNLRRLERRVFQRAGEGTLSARGEGSVSEFSCSSRTTWREGAPRSARPSARQGHPELEELLKSLAPGASGHEASSSRAQALATVPEAQGQQLSRWSEVAKHAKLVEDREKEQQREITRSQQQQMRLDLQLQMEEKKLHKQRIAEEDRQLFQHQEAELERWKLSQSALKEEAKNKALQVNKEREEQRSRMEQLREVETQRKREEDHKLVQKAACELDMEVKRLHDRKADSRRHQQQMVAAMKEEQKLKDQQRQLQVEEERRKVKEYHRMLEEQQERHRQHIPPVRTAHELPELSPLQRSKETYSDENVLRQQRELTRRAEEAESQRIERLKMDRQTNQDFLFQQIAERDRKKQQVEELKGSAKKAAQAATADFVDAERRRVEEQREKNIRYRLELEQQISAKRVGQQPRQAEDQMSKAERAINRRLLNEALELRGQLAKREHAEA